MRSSIVANVLTRFLLTSKVANRVSMEFSSPEAMKTYLHEHPHADPKNHSVKKHENTPKKDESSSSSHGKGLFSHAEVAKLPDSSQQKIKDRDALFKQAAQAHQEQVEWLNQGKGIDKAIGAKVIRGDKKPLEEFLSDLSTETDKPGPLVVIGPMKSADRSKEKVDADYGGDWSQLGDIVRSTIAVDSMDQLDDVMAKLKASGLKLAQKPKDRFAKPTEAGYRDLMMKVEFPNGHIGEMQLHLKPVLKAKEAGHHLYDKVRTIEGKAKQEGRTTLTPEEQQIVDDANEKSAKLYKEAWDKATKGHHEKTAAMEDKTAKSGIKYYEYDDFPAKCERGKFPVQIVKGKERVVYDLETFFREADALSEREYLDLLKQQK